jgi:hypothetical protein
MDAKQGAAADHVVASVRAERFQACGDVGELLELVEQDQRFARYEFLRRVQQRDVFDDAGDVIAVRGDGLVLGSKAKLISMNCSYLPAAKCRMDSVFPICLAPFTIRGLWYGSCVHVSRTPSIFRFRYIFGASLQCHYTV